MAGVGQYPSQGEAASAVKTAMHAVALATLNPTPAVLDPVPHVAFGYPSSLDFDDIVAVTEVRVQPASSDVVSPTRRRELDVYVDLMVSAWRVTNEDQDVHHVAYRLLDLVDTAYRTDTTLGGAVLWCFSDDLQSSGTTPEEMTGDGRFHEITATYRSRVIIRN